MNITKKMVIDFVNHKKSAEYKAKLGSWSLYMRNVGFMFSLVEQDKPLGSICPVMKKLKLSELITENKTLKDIEIYRFYDLYSNIMLDSGCNLPKTLSKARKNKIWNFLNLDLVTEQSLDECLFKATNSKFLMKSSWFTIDWFCKEDNFIKILEGNFEGSDEVPEYKKLSKYSWVGEFIDE